MNKFDRDEYREWSKKNQYNIPRALEHYAPRFNLVSWDQAICIYANSVAMVNAIYNVEVISDMPFGKGYAAAKNLWFEMMEAAQKYAKEKMEKKDEVDYCGDEDLL